MSTSVEISKIKCKYYDKGYCKNKTNCLFYHPTSDCKEKCYNKEYRLRHRILCRYRQYCYHQMSGQPEFVHLRKNIHNVPMAVNDDQQGEAHKVILAAQSTDYKEQYEKQSETIDNLNKLNSEYKVEIEELKNKLNEEIENKEKQIHNKDQYKKELEEEKQKTMYINLQKT